METKKEMFRIEGNVFITKKEDKENNPIINLMKDSKMYLIKVMFVGYVPIKKKMGDYFHEWLDN